MAATKHVSCGVDLHFVHDISESLLAAGNSGFKFVAADISHPRYRQEFLNSDSTLQTKPFARSDLVLPSQDWSSLVILKLSRSINVDSPIEITRRTSEKILHRELGYAAHLGVPAIMLQLRSVQCINLARMLHNYILAATAYQMMFQAWVLVPMESPVDACHRYYASTDEMCHNEDDDGTPRDDPWEWWNTFRNLCGTEKRLGVALRMSADLPSESSLRRWLGEPVRCVVIPTSLFMTNKKGYPVLSKAHQTVIHRFFKMSAQIIVQGSCHHDHMKHYYQYIDHLYGSQPLDDPLAEFSKGFEDYLQIPLQPLMDNLESSTYEIFEKDPVKYTEYQRAMYLALMDKGKQVGTDKEIILMVVGAGRGPLVRAALNASESAGQKVKVYAVEKNPNAVVTLLNQKRESWQERVTVVSCDMREFSPPEKADILVSELLGSFGDNELSPECLDGAQRFLKEDGVSIPASYQSFLGPIQSHKLYSELAGMRERDKQPLTPFEMPYVVRLQNVAELAMPQSLFSFHHPNKDKVIDNSRYRSLKFHIKDNCVLHGFAGYFDTVLYKDVTLSIYPNSHSPGMFSWFPIFFPIKEPLVLSRNSCLEVHFWRCVTPRKVWYEWVVTKPVVGTVHNPCGRAYTIGL
ncbi:protein arginine N-methyltransferase 5-like isoform X2 [Ornithodoros turicata]|uniref:Protein arginine N-methyltransferase n=1 Tax=Ornithodoros turicata TaxID=34597 RepID=A0A2R5LLY5_9ACAR